MLRFVFILLIGTIFFSCGRENPIRNSQFDILEKSADQIPVKNTPTHLTIENIGLTYPNFGGHPFSKLMQHLIKLDTIGVFCVGQQKIKIKYKVLWATDHVLSMDQEILMDCPMAEGQRKTTVYYLFTRQGKQINRLFLEGSPGLLQDIRVALRKRNAPYCSAPKIEEVFPVLRSGRVEVTPHYASSLCDTTFRRKGISRTDLRIRSNQSFLKLP